LRTLGSSYLALLLQAQGNVGASSNRTDATSVLNLLATATPVSMAVLLTLLALSVVSWSIILYKLWVFGRSRRQSVNFLDVFRRSNKFSEVQAVCRSLGESPLVGLFQAGYAELTAQLRQSSGIDTAETQAPNPKAVANRPTLKSLTAVDRALMRASVVEVNKLEKRLPFLATTASIAPFVGLFGTVVGIIMAFQGIGATGSTNLSVVAPGIADALIATAAGLVAAIPAVVAYNHLSNRVRLFAAEMDDFAMEFLNIAERNFT
jgi:biopolymer transport protein TolQ